MVLAMPAEKSGQDEFDFEYGSEFGAHIEAFDPTFTKVLVRYNPEGDGAMNARQTARLRELSRWLHRAGRRFLFELLVPAEPHQLEAAGNDPLRFDREVRPGLMKVAIAELQESGIEPDVWKIEGIDDPESARRSPSSAAPEVATASGAWCSAAAPTTRPSTRGCVPRAGVRATRASRSAARSGGTR